MGHVFTMTLALIIYVMMSLTEAIQYKCEKATQNCGNNRRLSNDERYLSVKPHFEYYRTIDPNDLKDPNAGILKLEDFDDYQNGVKTMDLSMLKTVEPKLKDQAKVESILDPKIEHLEGTEGEEIEKTVHEDEKVVTVYKNVAEPYVVEKIVHYPVLKKIFHPVKIPVAEPFLVEKSIPVPFKLIIKVPQKIPHPVPVYKEVPYVVQVPIDHPVPYRTYIPDPRPVEKKVFYEMKIPVPQPFPIERNIPIPVKMPVADLQPIPVEHKVFYPVEIKAEKSFSNSKPFSYTHFDNPTDELKNHSVDEYQFDEHAMGDEGKSDEHTIDKKSDSDIEKKVSQVEGSAIETTSPVTDNSNKKSEK